MLILVPPIRGGVDELSSSPTAGCTCVSNLGLVLPAQFHGWPLPAGLGCQGWQRLEGTQTPGFPGSDKTTVGGGGEGHLQGTLSPCLCGAALVLSGSRAGRAQGMGVG